MDFFVGKNTPRSTLAKYQLEQRNKIGKINDTRIYVKNSFIEEKPRVNQDKIHYIINLYNYIDFHRSSHKNNRDQYKRKYKHGITKHLPISKDSYTINPVLKSRKTHPLFFLTILLCYLTFLFASSWMIF